MECPYAVKPPALFKRRIYTIVSYFLIFCIEKFAEFKFRPFQYMFIVFPQLIR